MTVCDHSEPAACRVRYGCPTSGGSETEVARWVGAAQGRCAAATSGPWDVCDPNEGSGLPPFWEIANDAFYNPPADDEGPWVAVGMHTGCKADAEFVAAARTDLPTALRALAGVLAWCDLAAESDNPTRLAAAGQIRDVLHLAITEADRG